MEKDIKQTKHPKTGKWENASWIDDYFGKHHYGVEFPSDKNSYVYDPEIIELETRDSTPDKKEISKCCGAEKAKNIEGGIIEPNYCSKCGKPFQAQDQKGEERHSIHGAGCKCLICFPQENKKEGNKCGNIFCKILDCSLHCRRCGSGCPHITTYNHDSLNPKGEIRCKFPKENKKECEHYKMPYHFEGEPEHNMCGKCFKKLEDAPAPEEGWERELDDILLDVCIKRDCNAPQEHKYYLPIIKERIQKLLSSTLDEYKKKVVSEVEKIDVSGGGNGRRLKVQILSLLQLMREKK